VTLVTSSKDVGPEMLVRTEQEDDDDDDADRDKPPRVHPLLR
jgi:hypothetical protein